MLWPLQCLLKDLYEFASESQSYMADVVISFTFLMQYISQLRRWLRFDFFSFYTTVTSSFSLFLILLKAAESGNKEAARVLLHHGARCVERDFALHSTILAIRTSSWWYDEAGGDFKSITNTQKNIPQVWGRLDERCLLRTTTTNTKTHLRVEDRNTAGLSSLHIAARSGQLATTSLLLQNTHQVLASWSSWQYYSCGCRNFDHHDKVNLVVIAILMGRMKRPACFCILHSLDFLDMIW